MHVDKIWYYASVLYMSWSITFVISVLTETIPALRGKKKERNEFEELTKKYNASTQESLEQAKSHKKLVKKCREQTTEIQSLRARLREWETRASQFPHAKGSIRRKHLQEVQVQEVQANEVMSATAPKASETKIEAELIELHQEFDDLWQENQYLDHLATSLQTALDTKDIRRLQDIATSNPDVAGQIKEIQRILELPADLRVLACWKDLPTTFNWGDTQGKIIYERQFLDSINTEKGCAGEEVKTVVCAAIRVLASQMPQKSQGTLKTEKYFNGEPGELVSRASRRIRLIWQKSGDGNLVIKRFFKRSETWKARHS